MFLSIRIQLLAVSLLVLITTGCTTQGSNKYAANLPPLPEHQIDGIPELDISVRDIYQLTNKQKRKFFHYYNNYENRNIEPHQRLANYLTKYMQTFDYSGDTLTASEAISNMTGDCVSLAIVTSAYAQLVGVRYLHRKVNRAPIYMRNKNVIIVAQHLRTILFKPKYDTDDITANVWTEHINIDYYKADTDIPADPMTYDEFNALFFANLAATRLMNGDLIPAYQYSKKALDIAPHHQENVNLHALVLKRLGYQEMAMSLFDYGYQHLPPSINLLTNYQTLAQNMGNNELAKNIEQKLMTLKDANPYQWLTLGYEHYDKNKFSKAYSYFEKAKNKAPYLDDVYIALAKASYSLGKRRAAKDYLELALEAPVKSNDVNLVKAKLANFNN